MPGQVRPNEKLLKVLNTILQKPNDQKQKNEKKPSEKRQQAWMINSYSVTSR